MSVLLFFHQSVYNAAALPLTKALPGKHKGNAAFVTSNTESERRISILRNVLSDLRGTSTDSTQQPERVASTFQKESCSLDRPPVKPASFLHPIKQTHLVNFPPLIPSDGRSDACHVKSCTGGGFSLLSTLSSAHLSPSRVGIRCRFCCVSSS